VEAHGLDPDVPWAGQTEEESGFVIVYLIDEHRVLARFLLVETPRPEAEGAVVALRRMGIEMGVLTGDRSGPADRVGDRLALPVQAELLPEDKLRALVAARQDGLTVGMVGDGINDAPVLAAADVGFAMGSATDLARQAGNVHLISDRLDRVPLAVAIARHGLRRIRLNLAWAFGYNGVGITLAAVGLLSPVFAALAMFLSSLTVVLISRGAGRVSPASLGLAGADADSIGASPAGSELARPVALGS
jgi:P-type E1-E2 ATPase